MRHPVDVRLHARLDRPRRGRPDAPADRAARDAARDAQPRRRAPGRLQRDRARLAPRAAPDRPPDGAGAVAPGPARVGPGRRCPTTRSSAAPTCCARATGGDPQVDPDGDRARRSTSRNDAAKLLEADGIRVRLVSMPCLDRFAEQDRAYRDEVLPPAVPRPRRGRGGEPDRLAPLGRRRRRRRRDGGLRRLGAREGALRALRLHRRGDRRARPRGAQRGRRHERTPSTSASPR